MTRKIHDARPRRMTIPDLKEQLDRIFSSYIRLRDADENGFCRCITCGKVFHWQEIHNGHYIPRQHMATRFDERNCHVQCPVCNISLRGNLDIYKRVIIRMYGVRVLEELESSKRSIEKWLASDYEEKIAYYIKEVERLKKEKGL